MSLRPGDFVIKDRLPKAPPKYDQQNEHQFRRILELVRLESGSSAALADINAKVFEAFDHTGTGSSAGVALLPTGSYRNSATTTPFFTANTAGAGHVFSVVGGQAIAARASTGSDGAMCLSPAWPVYSDLSGSGADMTLIDAYRYTWSCFVERSAATAEFGIRTNVQALATTGTNMGWAVRDNAGTWELAVRLTSGGAITTPSVNFSATSTDPHLFQFVYTEYEEGEADATFRIYVDGEVWYSVTGVSNMPAQPASASTQYGPMMFGNIYSARNYLSVESMFEINAAVESLSLSFGSNTESITTVAANYDALVTDGTILVNTGSGAVTITLPIATSMVGRSITVKKITADGNAVTVDGNSALIDGAATQSLPAQWDSLWMICNGTNWFIRASV